MISGFIDEREQTIEEIPDFLKFKNNRLLCNMTHYSVHDHPVVAALLLTAASRWFMFMNYAVHSIMYTYYALCSYGLRPPRWVSMTVTSLQTAQMLVGVGISLFVAHVKWIQGRLCNQSDANLLFCFAIYISFAILFVRFFVCSYLFKKSPKVVKKD